MTTNRNGLLQGDQPLTYDVVADGIQKSIEQGSVLPVMLHPFKFPPRKSIVSSRWVT
jgi:hypothetical protein